MAKKTHNSIWAILFTTKAQNKQGRETADSEYKEKDISKKLEQKEAEEECKKKNEMI